MPKYVLATMFMGLALVGCGEQTEEDAIGQKDAKRPNPAVKLNLDLKKTNSIAWPGKGGWGYGDLLQYCVGLECRQEAALDVELEMPPFALMLRDKKTGRKLEIGESEVLKELGVALGQPGLEGAITFTVSQKNPAQWNGLAIQIFKSSAGMHGVKGENGHAGVALQPGSYIAWCEPRWRKTARKVADKSNVVEFTLGDAPRIPEKYVIAETAGKHGPEEETAESRKGPGAVSSNNAD